MTRKEGHTGIINIRLLREKKKKKRRKRGKEEGKFKKQKRIAGLLLVCRLTWGTQAPPSRPDENLSNFWARKNKQTWKKPTPGPLAGPTPGGGSHRTPPAPRPRGSGGPAGVPIPLPGRAEGNRSPGRRQQGRVTEPAKRSKETSVARLLLSSLRQNKSAPPGLGLNVAHWIINSIFPALL